MSSWMRAIAAAFLVAAALLLSACARVQDSACDEYYANHGATWRIFHPRVIAGRPWWQQTLYWIGPGHCPVCRTVLNVATDFDDRPSPYYETPAAIESATAQAGAQAQE